jgi:hypothetical protein
VAARARAVGNILELLLLVVIDIEIDAAAATPAIIGRASAAIMA